VALSEFLWGFLAGGAPSIVLAAVLVWWLARRRSGRRRASARSPAPRTDPALPPLLGDPPRADPRLDPPTPAAPTPTAPTPAAPPVGPVAPATVVPPAAPVAAAPEPTTGPVPAAEPARVEAPPVRPAEPRAEPEAPAAERRPPVPPARKRKGPVPPGLRIPYRILLHVARQGRVGSNEVPPDSLSQAGMVEALGVRQGAVAAALQRLVAAELLEVERSHVQGGDRRLKVYRLSPRGEELVRDLRRRGRGKG